MFMTYCVKRICRKHSWHVTLLKNPQSFRVKTITNIPHESSWIRQVIKHRNRSYDFSFLLTNFIKIIFIKKVRNKFYIFSIKFLKLCASRINSYFLQFLFIGFKKSCIITPNIKNDISCIQGNFRLNISHHFSQMANHSLIQSRTISIVMKIKLFSINIMFKL